MLCKKNSQGIHWPAYLLDRKRIELYITESPPIPINDSSDLTEGWDEVTRDKFNGVNHP